MELYPYQVEHAAKLLNIYNNIHFAAIDASETGTGKTVVACHIAKELGLNLFIVTRGILHTMWERTAAVFGLSLVSRRVEGFDGALNPITPEKLIGKRGVLNHPFLVRDANGKYRPTKWFANIVNRGIFLVFDECHYAKNGNTATFAACRTLIEYVRRSKSKSRVYLASATQGSRADKHSPSMLGMLGLYKCIELYEAIEGAGPRDYMELGRSVNLTGYKELVVRYRALINKNPELKEHEYDLWDKPTSASDVKAEACTLYTTSVKFFLSSEMPKPEHYDLYRDVANGFYDADKETIDALNRHVRNLRMHTSEREDGNRQVGKGTMAAINKAIKNIHYVLTPIAINEAIKVLEADPNSKVVFFSDYTRPLKDFADELHKYGSRILYGKTKKCIKQETVDLFQEDNNRCRVIACNTRVGSCGLSLDDTRGNRQRYAFLLPTYQSDSLIQSLGRFCRANTRSVMISRIVYVKGCGLDRIIKNLIAKTNNLTKMTNQDKSYLLPSNTEWDISTPK